MVTVILQPLSLKDGATGAKGDTGADGKNAKANVKDNKDGTHTVTITDGEGKTTTTIVKNGEDGKNAQAEVKDNKDGTHTVTIVDVTVNKLSQPLEMVKMVETVKMPTVHLV